MDAMAHGRFRLERARAYEEDMRKPILFSLAGFAAALMAGAAGAAPAYTVTDLGTLGGNFSSARAINATGAITGIAGDTGSQTTTPFLYQNGTMKSLGSLGGSVGIGNGVNASGEVAGYATNTETYRPFLYNGKRMKDIGDLGGGTADAYAINRRGDVVGTSH